MVILHTSDWHIGRLLYGRRRYDEHAAFLDWLADAVEREGADVLLVAGDVFDSGTPSNRAQEIYYRFLVRISSTRCRHVVITGGNHDSPSFLDAPRDLLRALRIHIVGAASERPEDEVLTLADEQGSPALVVCAVPYLRDRDLRTAEAGESYEDKERKMLEGIRAHYAAVLAIAQERRGAAGGNIPIVAMGHLFAAGGETSEGDGVRELYVGSLVRVDSGCFPPCIDYLALGHLHAAQCLQGLESRRYSGSPLPMGFGESGQSKGVVRIAFDGRQPVVTVLPVPAFQPLVRVGGDWENITAGIAALAAADSTAWLEITWDGAELAGTLRERLDELVAGTKMEILRIRNRRLLDKALECAETEETLDDLDSVEVFERCLQSYEVADLQRAELRGTYARLLQSMAEQDAQAI